MHCFPFFRRAFCAVIPVVVWACGSSGVDQPGGGGQLPHWVSLGSWQFDTASAASASVSLCHVQVQSDPGKDSVDVEFFSAADARAPYYIFDQAVYQGNGHGHLRGDSVMLSIGGHSTYSVDTVSFQATFVGVVDTASTPNRMAGYLIESDINGRDSVDYSLTQSVYASGCP